MQRAVHTASTAALTAAAVAVTLAGAVGIVAGVPPVRSPVGTALLAAVLTASLGYVAAREARRVLSGDPDFAPTAVDGGRWLAVATAAATTRWLAVDAALGAVVAAALVGLLARVVAPDYDLPAYCGSFVGMASPAVLPGYRTVALAGAVAGVVFVAAGRVFDGFGGKLGTTAFVGCGLVVLTTGASPGSTTAPPPSTAVLLVGAAGVAAVATFAVSVRLERGPVVGSAVVGLVAGLVCPSVLPAGESVAAAAFCASFAGMARPDRVPNEAAMLVAGLLSGALFVGTAPYFVGLGGKLGTIAFAACLSTCGLLSIGDRLLPFETDVPSV